MCLLKDHKEKWSLRFLKLSKRTFPTSHVQRVILLVYCCSVEVLGEANRAGTPTKGGVSFEPYSSLKMLMS